jgi:hypothetical protein
MKEILHKISSRKANILFATLFILCSLNAVGQTSKPMNYRKFDDKLLHFGFMLGINSASFTALPKQNAYAQFGLKSLVINSQPGGQVGIVSSLKCGTPYVRLRFLPSLSFQERSVLYTYKNPDPNATKDIFDEQRVNSTNLDFPLMFQFRTARLTNFATYLLAGAQYSIDLQSQQDASQNYADPFLKIKKFDIQGQIGGGIELFAPYFKFGIELKYSHGFNNSFIQDNTTVSKPIDLLYNRVWWISIIFEG